MDRRMRPDKFGGPRRPPDDGVVLFNPEPKEPLLQEEAAAPRRPPMLGIVLAGVAVLAVGGFFALRWASAEPESGTSPVPPIVQPASPSAGQTLTPLPSATVVGLVGDTVAVGVRARGALGALADTVVRFSIPDSVGAGVMREEVATDAEGLAVTTVTLPNVPGTFVVEARLAGAAERRATIEVQVRAGAPAVMRAAGGDGQTAAAGELLPSRLEVAVTDRSGNPVPGVDIEFTVRSGNGVRAPSRARTDSLGQASVLWRLGQVEGRQQLVASAGSALRPVVFSATATPALETVLTPERVTAVEAAPVTVRRTTFVIGGSHVCELGADGQLRCRGADDRGQTTPEGGDFTALASGISHVCGLGRDGTAYCWGANEAGQLGDGTLTDRREPVAVRTELRFSLLVAGAAHTCGLAGGGIPACWGLNLSGQIGDGSRNDQRGPRTVGGGLSFQTLTAGWNHTCALTANGNAFCWGLNSQGQLGDGSRLDRLVPTLVRGAVESIVAGSAHTCGLSAGSVICWGANAFGQLGNGTTDDSAQPVPVEGLPSGATWLAAGAVHTCALVPGGRAYCWGQNRQGQLGDGSTQSRASPTPVAGDLRFRSIYAGGALTCAFATDGTQYCWGTNGSGQLGDGTRVSRYEPTRVGS